MAIHEVIENGHRMFMDDDEFRLFSRKKSGCGCVVIIIILIIWLAKSCIDNYNKEGNNDADNSKDKIENVESSKSDGDQSSTYRKNVTKRHSKNSSKTESDQNTENRSESSEATPSTEKGSDEKEVKEATSEGSKAESEQSAGFRLEPVTDEQNPMKK